jgi:3-mercaptopyruvate sulfurtransferase SseA
MRVIHKTFTLFLVALGLLQGCAATSDKDLVFVNTTDAKEVIAGKPKLLGFGGADAGTWVDSRSEADFKAGHIPGAINLPFERVSEDHEILKGHKILIVYGDDYNDNRADAMSKRLMTLGHDDVRTLTGGIRAWKSDGNPVEASQ